MNLEKYLKEKKFLIEETLKGIILDISDGSLLNEAMEYSLLAGGKRLRPVLAIMACELFNGDIKSVLPFACSIELIHTYSLIHDDLPAMDNDDFRRGKLTNHKVFGEGFAILAGDALLNKSYEMLFSEISSNNKPTYINAALTIAKAAGICGMIAGQSMDLFYENKEISIEKLIDMHDKKTGALIRASLEAGAIIANAGERDIELIGEYGRLIGRAFQVRDDILDVMGIDKKLGKKTGKDEALQKTTYVKFYGLNKSKDISLKLINNAKEIISIYGERSHLFLEFADYVINRDF